MNVEVLTGDCREVMLGLAPGSFHTCVTSPPYLNHRDPYNEFDLGSPTDPVAFVRSMVEVFQGVRRVLRDDGTLWVVMGDSYASSGGSRSYGSSDGSVGRAKSRTGVRKPPTGIKPKDVIGIPWMVALAMREDGWYLRAPIIWEKPAHVPESVDDRVTISHEYIFMFSKSARYYYDKHAIAEPAKYARGKRLPDGVKGSTVRNARSVWHITPKPWSGDHFAVFPPDLPRRCIRAGTSEHGCCPSCGAPWIRVVDTTTTHHDASTGSAFPKGSHAHRISLARQAARRRGGELEYITKHRGWRPGCMCYKVRKWIENPDNTAELRKKQNSLLKSYTNLTTVSCVVLDPFGGAGTTGLVASQIGREAVLIELNPKYAKDARYRILSRGDVPPHEEEITPEEQSLRFF